MKRYARFGLVVLLAAGALAWAVFRPELLWVDARVNPSAPEGVPSVSAAAPMPAAGPLASGRFHGVAPRPRARRRSTGWLTAAESCASRTSTRPTDRTFACTWWRQADAADSATVTRAGFVEIAPLKGNIGDQNYELPASVNLERFRAVTIWCKRFSVNFATAPLAPTPRATS